MRLRCPTFFLVVLILPIVAASSPASSALPRVIHSYVRVLEDGTLAIRRHRIRLYGIHIPLIDESTCVQFVSPRRCAPRSVLALDFKIDGFVRCEPVNENADGTLNAVCRLQGEDLAAWMLEHGWAMVLPGAPFDYIALERIARSRKIGIWGTPADAIDRFR